LAGFTFAYRLSGGAPTIQDWLSKDTATHTKGDIVNLETGEIHLGATNDTDFVGAVLETVSATDSTTRVNVITDNDAVYSVTDASARLPGATLDIAGTTGAMTIASSSNADFIVVAESTATEPTLVRIQHGEHWLAP